MKFSEKMCVMLSKLFFRIPHPKSTSTIDEYAEEEFQTAKEFGRIFRSQITFENRDVLDLGCGLGGQTVYFSLKGAKTAIGIDINKKWIDAAMKFAKKKKAGKKVSFIRGDGANLPFEANTFDIIVMYDVMEHVPQGYYVLQECERVLRSGGFLYITFGPPWLNPYGAHLYDYISIPWCHLIFSEKTLVDVLMESKSSSPITDVNHVITQFQNLSKMTTRKFKRIVKKTGFETIFFEEQFNPKISFLRFFPLVKEFFVGSVICILKKRI